MSWFCRNVFLYHTLHSKALTSPFFFSSRNANYNRKVKREKKTTKKTRWEYSYLCNQLKVQTHIPGSGWKAALVFYRLHGQRCILLHWALWQLQPDVIKDIFIPIPWSDYFSANSTHTHTHTHTQTQTNTHSQRETKRQRDFILAIKCLRMM